MGQCRPGTRPGLPAPSGNQTVVLIAPHTRAHDIAQMLETDGRAQVRR